MAHGASSWLEMNINAFEFENMIGERTPDGQAEAQPFG
ncbi:hypothetical protein PCLA_04f0610 [Pseudomonas citronellolis]|nr:hypothetical protein PCLA_04f0610 [Pseudomonas citronellolis]